MNKVDKTDSGVLHALASVGEADAAKDAEVVRRGNKELYSLMKGNETPDDSLINEVDFIEEDEELNEIGGDYMNLVISEDVEPVVVKEIVDSLGRYSKKADSVFKNLDTTIVPFELVGIPNEVKEIKNYTIVDIAGNRYVYTNRVRESVVQTVVSKAMEKIAVGDYFKQLMNVNIQWNDKVFESLLLSPAECSMIASKLRRYQARVFITNSGSVYLLAGGTENAQ